MRILGFDPGAVRCGWAVLDSGPAYQASGVYGLERPKQGSKLEPYQSYRLRLIPFWVDTTMSLLSRYQPDKVISEVVPVVGGGNFVAATQSQLAATVTTVIHTVATLHDYEIGQLSAITVKTQIGGHKSATKVGVRDGVFNLLPPLRTRYKEWSGSKGQFDEPDAIALTLVALNKYGTK
jgi:Holliday junction resolvasome RuvABC endonuclease subunit